MPLHLDSTQFFSSEDSDLISPFPPLCAGTTHRSAQLLFYDLAEKIEQNLQRHFRDGEMKLYKKVDEMAAACSNW